ncbi:Acetyltransferase (GNAT) family protein [Nocardioides terrae]|uniref:Acetyltransferase (GNAT) family protein n=1 Tax=Nocardioides terrae TaxID=574651 RepID=A0A1I1DT22_9ACTN|nr:Acetyltransferase (GNAT) family protein [Nocardioides terrae]
MVRRLVPGELGPTGGPAFTDLLGVCEAWGDTSIVVRPESGDPVTIPLDLVVSGKPVPPRPSVRQRVSVRDAELRTASLAGIGTTALGEWQLRFEPAPVGRVRNRFNSCLGVGDPGLPLADAAEQVRRFYVDRDRPPRIQVELASATEDALRELGWTAVPGRDSHFLLGSLALVRRTLGSESVDGPAAPTVDVDGTRVTVTLGDLTRGEAGIDGDWLGVHNLSVEPAYRRRGLARAVLRELLGWGAEQGATTVWLHVQTDNEPALALYDTLGLRTHHSCRYLEAPVG